MSVVEVLQVGPYPPWIEENLNARFTMRRYFAADDKAAFLARHGGAIRAIATRGDLGADAALIAALPNLEIISVFGVGYDAVDVAAAHARGIHVTNTPDVLTGDVADFAVALLLALARDVPRAENWLKAGNWPRGNGFRLTTRVHGRRAGILGLGRIGTAIARRLEGFDMKIAYGAHAPKAHARDWEFIRDPVDLARRSDFLVVAAAATAETRHVVNGPVLEALGPDGMLVNISRASNIDEGALLDALEGGGIKGAALDVFDGEPEVDPRFLALDNVVLAPHMASGTIETRKAMGDLVLANLVAHFDGKPLITPVP